MLPSTVHRVQLKTHPEVNARIWSRTLDHVAMYSGASQQELTERILHLQREWDTERVLETSASAAVLVSTVLGFTRNRKWYLLTPVIAAFLLQHATQGWCPPLPVIRRLGVRTSGEILSEVVALKLLRGDFDQVGKTNVSLLRQTDLNRT